MSLRHALLGLLAEKPASGYELTQVFEASLQRFAWHARHSQIYPELNKLADEGLVTVVGSGARNRRTYGLTDDGRAELHRWLLSPPGAPSVRNESVLRMFLLTALPPDDAKAMLERFRSEGAHVEKVLAEIRSDDSPEAVLEFGQLAAEFGLRYFRMQQEWASWAIDQLEKATQTSPG
ncbi:PadR family transcriptional regulator [Pseudonocardia sediminis]|uniref:PadR family transcriptional regulator n=1 Tax=Pseudonocardia sediminis TaxID=1397368 RepID=A0A4Q7V317_PSEST|nr:PadR family transcriptional regulator [Pseudonocardia sediminis]RZT88972.1 PadR family transcriptional regulator [Pseudonocardia sediminis]